MLSLWLIPLVFKANKKEPDGIWAPNKENSIRKSDLDHKLSVGPLIDWPMFAVFMQDIEDAYCSHIWTSWLDPWNGYRLPICLVEPIWTAYG